MKMNSNPSLPPLSKGGEGGLEEEVIRYAFTFKPER